MTTEAKQPTATATWELKIDHDAQPGNVLPVLATLLLSLARKRTDSQLKPATATAGIGS